MVRVPSEGGGCGLGGVAGTTGGPFRFGNRDFTVLLQGANGSVPTLASLTLAFGANPTVFGCGPGCELLLPVVDLSGLVDTQGNARVSIPLPCDGALDGTVVHAQFVCITPGTDPCGLAPVSLSNRLRMELRD